MPCSASASPILFRLFILFPLIVRVSPFGANKTCLSTLNVKLANIKVQHRKNTRIAAAMADLTNNNDNTDAEETTTKQKRLVLVGGGHAHLQVIKGLNHASRPEGLDVVLIDLTDRPCYSGMVPSAVAGIYSPSEALVDLESLAEWAKIEFVKDRVIDIDVDAKVVTTKGGRQLPFDALSMDIGSTSRGLIDVPGAKDHTIPTRPISELVRRIEVATDALKENNNNNNNLGKEGQSIVNVVVVGGGAAGIELSMGALGRWKPIVGESNISVTVLNSFDRIFPDETPANREALLQQLEERGISIINDVKVNRVDQDSLLLESGERLGFTHCLWATGAECHSGLVHSLREHGLDVSENGWIRVNESFQSPSHPFVFAAGDCCTMDILGGGRSPPKAGVYAVRAGPVLVENLTRFLGYDNDTSEDVHNHNGGVDDDGERGNGDTSSSLTKYVPQKDFLKLLACGDGKALGFRFGIPIYGKWVFELKDAIDRSFLDLFRRENLPELELVPGQSYDISQYDASFNRPPPLPSIEAAVLLQRSDDDVDFRKAWNVLRDMAEDDAYRDNVLRYIPLAPSRDETAAVRQEAIGIETLLQN
jgi:NADH dehydrogenase FAD-containing subunit